MFQNPGTKLGDVAGAEGEDHVAVGSGSGGLTGSVLE
jgi:hypothetical protein